MCSLCATKKVVMPVRPSCMPWRAIMHNVFDGHGCGRHALRVDPGSDADPTGRSVWRRAAACNLPMHRPTQQSFDNVCVR